MRIIVCGSHTKGDRDVVFERLDYLAALRHVTFLAHGGAEFIDKFSGEWAKARGVPYREYAADWTKYGLAAGPIRNRQMLDKVRPHGIVAFPGNRGTRDMVGIAKRAGVPVWFPLGKPAVDGNATFHALPRL